MESLQNRSSGITSNAPQPRLKKLKLAVNHIAVEVKEKKTAIVDAEGNSSKYMCDYKVIARGEFSDSATIKPEIDDYIYLMEGARHTLQITTQDDRYLMVFSVHQVAACYTGISEKDVVEA